ncbi:MAG: hypothetical protein JWP01_437 [Myxococcales bacterium]|nr:hypothetical protein [Myxococcales bacterium]
MQSPPHEVRTAEWGFVQAHLDSPVEGERSPRRVGAQLLAQPDGSGGWSVVGVHYLPLR